MSLSHKPSLSATHVAYVQYCAPAHPPLNPSTAALTHPRLPATGTPARASAAAAKSASQTCATPAHPSGPPGVATRERAGQTSSHAWNPADGLGLGLAAHCCYPGLWKLQWGLGLPSVCMDRTPAPTNLPSWAGVQHSTSRPANEPPPHPACLSPCVPTTAPPRLSTPVFRRCVNITVPPIAVKVPQIPSFTLTMPNLTVPMVSVVLHTAPPARVRAVRPGGSPSPVLRRSPAPVLAAA